MFACLKNESAQFYAQKHINLGKQLLEKYLWSVAAIECVQVGSKASSLLWYFMHTYMSEGMSEFDEGHKKSHASTDCVKHASLPACLLPCTPFILPIIFSL